MPIMSALINYSGKDVYYSPRYIRSKDFYSPPTKRARTFSPFSLTSEDAETPSIEILPDECLFEIFRHLSEPQSRSSSACVSKRWLTLVSSIRTSEFCKSENTMEAESDGYLTRSLAGQKATDVRLAAISVGISSRGGLGKLSIWGNNSVRGVSNNGISSIAHGCPSLKTLSLWDVPTIGDEGLVAIAKGCPLLEKLDLCQCPLISDKGLIAIAQNCPNLITLSIDSCKRIGNESLTATGKHCLKLNSVFIKDCPLVGDQGIASLLSGSCVLTKVELQSLNLTDFSLAVIGHYGKALISLTLISLRSTSEKGFWVMGNALGLQKLASLSISSCRGVTDISLEAIAKGCLNLKNMSLRRCCFVSDNGLVAFSRATQSLKSLQLEECNRITLNGILGTLSNPKSKLKTLGLGKCKGIKDLEQATPLLSSSESLKSLSIRYCPQFGDSSLVQVGKLCTKIRNLDLSGLCGITDNALESIIESSEDGLVKVNLNGCVGLSDKSIKSIARLHGGTLEMLNLDGCAKVTDDSMFSIAKNCFVLNELDVSKCCISDSGIADLSRGGMQNLQIISLYGCSKVSDQCVPFLRELGESLISLDLKNCNGISNSAIELLIETLWRCDILS